MKTITTTLLDNYKSHASTLTTCWKLIRTDGVVMGFTSHVKDLIIDGITYVARTGYTPTAISSSSNLSVDNLDLEGLLSDGGITDEDIRAGAYDYAEVTVFEVNYKDPTAQNIVRRGNIGELTLKDGIYVTEIRGLAQRLTRVFIRTVLPDCDAELFDARCKISSASFVNTGTVTVLIDDRATFEVNLAAPARAVGYFSGGLITFTSGAAIGRSFEVSLHDETGAYADFFSLYLRSPWAITVGNTFSVQRGCDKQMETCRDIFDNIFNFRGFHKVPGNDAIFKTPKVKD